MPGSGSGSGSGAFTPTEMETLLMKASLFLVAACVALTGMATEAKADRNWTTTWYNNDGSSSNTNATFYSSIRGSLAGVYDHRGGRFVGQYTGGGAGFDGYWVQNTGSTRCNSAVDGSYYWGRARFQASGDTFSGSYDYCGSGQSLRWTGRAH